LTHPEERLTPEQTAEFVFFIKHIFVVEDGGPFVRVRHLAEVALGLFTKSK
jgi:hypothetical protein